MKKKLTFGVFILSMALIGSSFAELSAQEEIVGEFLQNAPEVSTTIVISQVYGGGGGSTGTYLHDYVELKNISSTPQSLSGLSLMYGSATGQFGSSSTNIFALPDVTLAPGQYYLVQASPAGSAGAALPVTPDVATTNLNMSGTNGKIALVTSGFAANTCGATATPCPLPNANIVDLVSWGTANNAEGGAATNGGAALTSTQGNVRKGVGCTDTDNNNADFDVVTAPTPRNMSTAPAVCSGSGTVKDAPSDFNGDGKTDFAIFRPNPNGLQAQATWWIRHNGPNTTEIVDFGLGTDFIVPADYDGDNSDDIAVWSGFRSPVGFWILRSSDNTAVFEQFGQSGDDPFVVGDYTGDGKDDIAIYRPGNNNTQSQFWYLASSGPFAGRHVTVDWGLGNDVPLPGDYNGDGFADYTVVRTTTGTQPAVVYTLFGSADHSSGNVAIRQFGLGNDAFVPGDWDGDGATDLAVSRASGGNFIWIYRPSGGGNDVWTQWGRSATDLEVHGDYDGDGRTDHAIWRTTNGTYIILKSTGGVVYEQWGNSDLGDTPTIWEVR